MKKIAISLLIFLSSVFNLLAQINTDRVMVIGKNALYFEDYVLAIQYFNQTISAKPYLADPYYFRAMAKFMLDDFKGAEQDATLCLQRNPYYTLAYQLRGAALQNQDKFVEAAGDYKRSLEFYPEDKLTLVNMGIVNMEMKYYDVAEKFLDVLLQRFPDYIPGYLTRAQMFIEQKDTTKAFANYNKAIEIDQYMAQSFSARGLLFLQQKNYNKSLADFDEAIRLDPYYVGNYINRGLVKYNINDLRGAMADYDRVIEMDSSNIIALFNRGLLRAQVADNNRAIKDFDKVISIEPNNTMAFLNRAMLHSQIGDSHAAIEDLNTVLTAHPEFFTGYYMRSEIKRKLNDLRGAERDFNLARAEEAKAKKMAVENPEPQKSKKIREENDNDIDKFNLLVVADQSSTEKNNKKYQSESRGRVQDYNSKVALEPKFVVTYYERSFEVNRPVYYSKTLDYLNNNLNLKWSLKVTNNEASLNELQIQAHFRSIDNYSKQISQTANNATLYFGRGIDFMLVQDYENALKDIEKAIALKPNFMMAYFTKAIILTKQLEYNPMENAEIASYIPTANAKGKIVDLAKNNNIKLPEISKKKFVYDDIVKTYETVIKLSPDFSFAYYNLGEIFSIEQDYRAAIDIYSKAINIEPEYAEAYFNRGLSKLSIGETSSGLDDLRKAGELGIVESYSIIKRMR